MSRTKRIAQEQKQRRARLSRLLKIMSQVEFDQEAVDDITEMIGSRQVIVRMKYVS